MAALMTLSWCAVLCAGWWSGSLTLWQGIFLTLASYWLLEVVRYRQYKGRTPGPALTTPLGIGALCEMVFRPIAFWQRQADFNKKGFSVNAMLGRFMVFVTDPNLCSKVMSNTEDYVLFLHPNAYWLFRRENITYLSPERHKQIRSLLIPGVYGKEALACYLTYQQRICEKHLSRLIGAGEVDARPKLRLMNADASQESFAGPYLTSEQKDELSEDILVFTRGFLCFPLPLPFTGLGKAISAGHRIRSILANVAGRAKEYMSQGGQPRCVADYWAQEVVTRRKESAPGSPDVVTNEDMAFTLLSFIFASQDATTSAVVWALDLFTANTKGREILEKLRRECGAGDGDATPMEKLIAPGSYAHACAAEILRVQPPVPMVPHLAKKRIHLSDSFVMPEGTMIIPSITGAARHEPHAGIFDPDTGAKDPQFNGTLVFGAGQHKCPGRAYAVQLLTVYLVTLARGYVFERRKTAESDKFVYLPTRFPKDNWYTFTRYQPQPATA